MKRGFTLIELLVVIAIIGILSAVVLASLGTARAKGDDAGVLANVSTVATQAAIYVSSNNQYGSFDGSVAGQGATCPKPGTTGSSLFNDPTVENAVTAALSDAGSGGITRCYASGQSYAVAVSRPSAVVASKSYFWCTDSTGLSCGNDGNAGDGLTPIENGMCVTCTIND